MKKIIALVLIVALAFALAACKRNTDDPTENGGGGSNGSVTCPNRTHRDDDGNFVCDDCGLNLENEIWFDHNGVQHFPMQDL